MSLPARLVPAVLALGLAVAGESSAQAEPYHGLYYYSSRGYTYLAPDGRFFLGKPRWRQNGALDMDASIEGAKPYHHGSYQVGPPDSDGARDLVLTRQDGQLRRYRLARMSDGRWQIRRDQGTQIRPAAVRELSGTWKAAFSYSAGRDIGTLRPRDVDVNLTVGTNDQITFLPGHRFTLDSQSYAIAAKTHGTLTGNTSGEAKQSARREGGQGTYRIHGLFLTLKFDDGRVQQDLFHEITSVSSTRRIVIGGRAYQQR